MKRATHALWLLLTAVPATAQCPNPAAGPDVYVGDFVGLDLYAAQGGVAAYGFGTTLCNGGDADATWVSSSAEHPVSVLALYRLEDGRFEQLGLSWAHHESPALEQQLCCTCQPTPGSSQLGVGCSTTSSPGIVSTQGLFGPRSEVDAASGVFAYPFGGAAVSSPLDRRLQVAVADIDPALHPGAQYFAEVRVVAPDDASAGNRANNASWRAVTVGAPANGAFQLNVSGPLFPEEAAVEAWAAIDANVQLERGVLAGDGEVCLASRATDVGGGLWLYEYALANFTSARGIGRVRVPLPANANVPVWGFHDVTHHSGEPYDSSDWALTLGVGYLDVATTPFAQDPNANAVRWGTTYNVRFVVDAPPASGAVYLEAFGPGTGPGSGPGLVLDAVAPQTFLGSSSTCPAQPNSTGVGASLSLHGSAVASSNALVARTQSLPPSQFGYLLASQTQGFVMGPGGSQGDLCVAGNIGRFTAQVASSGSAGVIVVAPDLGAVPTNPPQAVLAGENWTFQLWYRDQNPGPTSNFSDAVALTFQ